MIKLRGNWMGTESNNRVIAKGEYTDNDPALFGLAEYLVANGHAIALESPQSETVTEVQTPATVNTAKPKSKR